MRILKNKFTLPGVTKDTVECCWATGCVCAAWNTCSIHNRQMSSLPLAEYRCIVCVQKQAEAAADRLAVMATDLGQSRFARLARGLLICRRLLHLGLEKHSDGLCGYTRAHCYSSLKFVVPIGVPDTKENSEA